MIASKNVDIKRKEKARDKAQKNPVKLRAEARSLTQKVRLGKGFWMPVALEFVRIVFLRSRSA